MVKNPKNRSLSPCFEYIYIYISMVYVYPLINANTSNGIYYIYNVYIYACTFHIYILTLIAYRGTQCTVFTSLERFGIVISTTKEVCFPILTCFTKGGWQGGMFSVTPLMAKHLNAHLTQWKKHCGWFWHMTFYDHDEHHYQNPAKTQCSQTISLLNLFVIWTRFGLWASLGMPNLNLPVENHAPCGFDSCHPKPRRRCQSQTDFGRTWVLKKLKICGKTDKMRQI